MRALNAAALKPISVLSDRKIESRKNSSLSTASPLKLSSSFNLNNNQSNLTEGLSSKIHGSLLILSSAAGTGFATALTYDEALQQSVRTSTSEGFSGFDVGGFIDTVVNFGVENPAVVVGGIVILAVPLVLSQVLSKPKPWGVESARNAYTKLADDGNTRLLDIRAQAELRKVGSPDIRGLKKKPVAVAYKGEDKPGFLKKLSLKFKEPENTTLFILDKFDGNSELVAELVTANGFKAAYAIKDGAEGSRGWMNSNLPWILPKKTPSLDFSNLTDAISDAIGDGVDGLSVALGVAAATGFGLLAFSEVETILQLFGSAALVQFVSKKLLFAEDRKQTIEQVDAFLNTTVAPKELVDDIKQIGKALLPSPVISKALPAPAQATSTATMPQENSASPKVAIAESTPEINSVPKSEVKAESNPGIAKPLSPYPCYPDFKPPTSPTPSQPESPYYKFRNQVRFARDEVNYKIVLKYYALPCCKFTYKICNKWTI